MDMEQQKQQNCKKNVNKVVNRNVIKLAQAGLNEVNK